MDDGLEQFTDEELAGYIEEQANWVWREAGFMRKKLAEDEEFDLPGHADPIEDHLREMAEIVELIKARKEEE